jgi:tyrosyl-tRNA synthetase
VDVQGKAAGRDNLPKLTVLTPCLQVVNSACLSLYCGFDPTADSLHLGKDLRQAPAGLL